MSLIKHTHSRPACLHRFAFFFLLQACGVAGSPSVGNFQGTLLLEGQKDMHVAKATNGCAVFAACRCGVHLLTVPDVR